MYTVYRIERDGTETVIACIDNIEELNLVMAADRDQVDFDAGYHIVNNGDGKTK